MKRHGQLFERAFTIEALYAAYLAASKNKRKKRAHFQFYRCLGKNLADLHTELHTGVYCPRPYYEFMVLEPKPRRIFAPAFRDCVVQHAIYSLILPIFNQTFIDQSFACRPGYGTHRAADYAQAALRQSPSGTYTLKLDIRKFFYRIDREILRRLIERKIKDLRFIEVMMLFVDYGEPLGIPIGNLLSQIYALIYLNPLDHFIKRQLHVRYYCRYVDDFVLFGLARDEAISYRKEIIDFLEQRLNLELSKSTIAPSNRGLNFVGYRTWRSKRFIRKRSLYCARRVIHRQQQQSIISILGHARKTHSLQMLLHTIRKLNYACYCALPARLRRLHRISGERPGR